MTTPQKRVHFNRDISKFSIGSKTPTIERLSSNSILNPTSNNNIINNKTKQISNQHNNNQQPNESNQIIVAVRIRPLNNKEIFQGFHNAIRLNESNKEICVNDRTNKPLKFTCDHIITDQRSADNISCSNNSQNELDIIGDSQQKYVYESIGKPLLDKAFDGYNVSIFAYGQTGSGKTFSMIGTDKQPGLIPRFFDELFERKLHRDQVVSSTHIEISYYEIYNEKIYDLLRSTSGSNESKDNSKVSVNGKNLQIRENPQTGPYIVDLLTLSANSASDAKLWLDIGNKRRATACTNMNQKSSRSHSVFQINLTQMLEHQSSSNSNNNQTGQSNSIKPNESNSKLLQLVTSRINLVDLAGSERINSSFTSNNSSSSSTALFSSANNTQLTSSRLKESTCINKSLLTLGKIICLLSERQSSNSFNLPTTGNNNAAIINSSNTVSNAGYLPYRESVLTWLLKESLGGNAKTAMLATVNASSNFIDETICTLRYAAKTACIKNTAHLNRNFKQKYINELGQEQEMNLVIAPISAGFESSLIKKNDELQLTLKLMEQEWKDKLEEAEKLKEKEIKDLEKSLIVLYENETRAQNCCLINLNEDPSLSEKLIYLLKSNNTSNNNNDQIETLIGSDKNLVNILLSGALIAPIHCKIVFKPEQTQNEAHDYFIEQLDENYVTYLNGEVINNNQKYQLNHGDRIIFGGSHFFRFNNPKTLLAKQANNTSNNDNTVNESSKSSSTSSLNDQFKDYQFAKNEIEKKQNELIQKKLNEALNECKRDGDLKIKELKQQYEKNIESIKNDLEKEKSARKAELELIKSENQKKLKKIVEKKILIETKLSKVQSEVAETFKEIDKHEKELTDDSISSMSSENSLFRTPSTNSIANRRFLNKLYSDKKNSTNVRSFDQELVQLHANSSCLFSIALRVTEANKICNILGYDYEIKRYEIPEYSNPDNMNSSSQSVLNNKTYNQAISVIDKRLNLITLWNMETFEFKLNMLRELYNKYMDDGSVSSSNSMGQNESIFLSDSMDEWQTLEAFNQNDLTFSPRVIENAFGHLNDKKFCKRRLSIMSVNSTMNNLSIDSNLSIKKSSDLSETHQINDDNKKSEDQLDSINQSIKLKAIPHTPIQTPLRQQNIVQHTPMIPFTPGSIVKAKSFDTGLNLNNSFNQLGVCNSFVYATCRDALNDDDFQIDDEDDLLDDIEDDEDENNLENTSDKTKNPKSIPIMDDIYLKYYARLIYNLNKLMEFHLTDMKNSSKKLNEENQNDKNSLSSIDYLNNNNDQPLYCMKIIILYSQLSQFKPDYWSLVNGENLLKIKKIYLKIGKLLKTVKDSINYLFQSIENNIEPMLKSKYDLILSQLSKLIFLHGEYMFLTSSNTFLNRNNYSLNMIDSKFLHEYSKGIDKQFEEFLAIKLNSLKSKNAIFDYVQNIKNFWAETHRSRIVTENLPSSDLIIDYCNYLLQTHFRLSNAFKIMKHVDQLDDPKLKSKLNEQILGSMYNILTDSLALDALLNVDEATENQVEKNKSKWNDSFIKTFKEFKQHLKNTCESSKNSSILKDTSNLKENSILDGSRISNV